ncbi:MAG: OmpA family protein [Acidobacteriota bacterium]
MADSLLGSLRNMIDQRGLAGIARSTGESDQSVARGMESSIAAVLNGVANKADDPGALRNLLDASSSSAARDATWDRVTSAASDASSPIVSEGRRLVSSIFGSSESTVVDSISRDSGLRAGSVTTMLSLAAPLVIGYLGRRVRDGGMTVSGLGSLLRSDMGNIRNALPSGLADIWRGSEARSEARGVRDDRTPAAAQGAEPARRSLGWLWPVIALGALLLALLWFGRGRHREQASVAPPQPMGQQRPIRTDEANRVPEAAQNLGQFVKRTLPDRVDINIPERGVEARLLAFVQDPNRPVDRTTWFDFDRLVFDTGSANLRPESKEQLDNVAAILKAYPNVHIKVGGYTDNVGNADQNMKLSQDRAAAVVAELTNRGIDASRLTSEGYGQEHPVADNSSEEGRMQNRRVSMRVTQK